MKEILNITLNSYNSIGIYTKAEELAKFLDLKCDVRLDGTSFGFPMNRVHYKIYLEGEQDNIETFKKEII